MATRGNDIGGALIPEIRSTPAVSAAATAAGTDCGRITAGIKSVNGRMSKGIANTSHSQFEGRPRSDRTGGTMYRTASNPRSAAAVAIRIRSGTTPGAGLTAASLVDRVLDVVDTNQAPVADGQADHVEAELTAVRPHL